MKIRKLIRDEGKSSFQGVQTRSACSARVQNDRESLYNEGMNENQTLEPRHPAMLIHTSKDHGEITELAYAADFTIRQVASQVLDAPTKKYFLGSGKVKEIQDILAEHPEIESVLFDTDLTPLQVRNLEEAFDRSIVDRTDLILQIFLQRAASAQSRLQVENAILKRSKNRLTRQNINFSRQGGGMKNKGAGETQLELDRRNIQAQIAANDKELKKLEKQRNIQRSSRSKSDLPLVSLAGYTNAGKSTILNGLLKLSSPDSEKTVLEKDMLFATLDPAVRRIERPLKRSFLLTDTVGFISNLPHDLIQGFQTTLEEIRLADLIVLVMDLSSPDYNNQKNVVLQTLKEIEADEIDRLLVKNKADDAFEEYPVAGGQSLQICARETSSLELLASRIEEQLFGPIVEKEIAIPYKDGAVFSRLFEDVEILDRYDDHEGLKARVKISSHLLNRYLPYIVKGSVHLQDQNLQEDDEQVTEDQEENSEA